MKTPTVLLIAAFLLLIGPIALRAQEIFDAIRGGDIAKVKELVDKAPQLVKARNARQSIPLHVAVDSENESMASICSLSAASTGNMLLFWVDASIIQDLRKEALKDDNVTARGGKS